LLAQKGYRVLALEKQLFPRFSIGESLLPQCMAFLEEANMIDAIKDGGFQFKNGATFQRRGEMSYFDFSEKFTEGWPSTYQVQRANFDKILADEAEKQGVEIHYEHEITAINTPDINSANKNEVSVACKDKDGNSYTIQGRFLLDASGFGRVLPRLLNLEKPSDFPVRHSLFSQVIDNISDQEYDRNKIVITIHPEHKDVWYWLIPFGDGRCSLGVVAEPAFYEKYAHLDENTRLQTIINEDPYLKKLLANAQYDRPIQTIKGYSASVTTLCGPGFALLGNAGEFLDPVFSSGVTIALKSASLASKVLDRQLQGQSVDWQSEYAEPLMIGVNAFRTYVEAWYDGRFQDVIYYQGQQPEVKRMICSILAGYAWDTNNPYVKESQRRLNVLAQLCQEN
jgi:flavin-dependent dehydrogenase